MSAWIKMVPPEEAEGRLKEVYDWQAERLGKPALLTQIGSLDPEAHFDSWAAIPEQPAPVARDA